MTTCVAFDPFASSKAVKAIVSATSSFYGVAESDLSSARRFDRLVKPRHIAMCLTKSLTKRSNRYIGQRFGGRDHKTVFHAVRKISAQIQADPTLAAEVDAIRRQIAGAAA